MTQDTAAFYLGEMFADGVDLLNGGAGFQQQTIGLDFLRQVERTAWAYEQARSASADEAENRPFSDFLDSSKQGPSSRDTAFIRKRVAGAMEMERGQGGGCPIWRDDFAHDLFGSECLLTAESHSGSRFAGTDYGDWPRQFDPSIAADFYEAAIGLRPERCLDQAGGLHGFDGRAEDGNGVFAQAV